MSEDLATGLHTAKHSWEGKPLEALPHDELLEAARWYRQAWLELCDAIARLHAEVKSAVQWQTKE